MRYWSFYWRKFRWWNLLVDIFEKIVIDRVVNIIVCVLKEYCNCVLLVLLFVLINVCLSNLEIISFSLDSNCR